MQHQHRHQRLSLPVAGWTPRLLDNSSDLAKSNGRPLACIPGPPWLLRRREVFKDAVWTRGRYVPVQFGAKMDGRRRSIRAREGWNWEVRGSCGGCEGSGTECKEAGILWKRRGGEKKVFLFICMVVLSFWMIGVYSKCTMVLNQSIMTDSSSAGGYWVEFFGMPNLSLTYPLNSQQARWRG